MDNQLQNHVEQDICAIVKDTTKLEKKFHILKVLNLSRTIKHPSIKLPTCTKIAKAYLFDHHTSNTTKSINLWPSKLSLAIFSTTD